ncbi:MAG: MFS transporter, partial [Chloroflexota bacterium]
MTGRTPGPLRDARLPAGILACISLLVAGWTLTLFPSLIRSVKEAFVQTDAGIGFAYLLYALAYAAGSFGGGVLIERVGRKRILAGAALANALGLAGLGLAPTWALFLAAVMLSGLGAGALEGGANGVVLDAYRDVRGRAMSLLHVSFGVGAFGAPLMVSLFLGLGVPWQALAIGSGAAITLLALGYWTAPVPSGRRTHDAAGSLADGAGPGVATSGVITPIGRRRPELLNGPMLLLGLAIAAYVASAIGIASWVVRFLEPAPLATATAA